LKSVMFVGSQFINKSKDLYRISSLIISIKWMKRKILGTDILFDNITALTDVKHRRFTVNIRQLNNTEVSVRVHSKTRNISHGMKIISAC
jgi:hypothetical protein